MIGIGEGGSHGVQWGCSKIWVREVVWGGGGVQGGRVGSPEGLAIMLAQALEDNRPGRGVHPHGKGLSGEQHLDEAPAEQHLHHLLHDRQQPCMPP